MSGSGGFSTSVPRGRGQTILVAVLDENNEPVWTTRFIRAEITLKHDYEDLEISSWSGVTVSTSSRTVNTRLTIEGEAVAD